MYISGIAIGQWNQICRKQGTVGEINYKIHRAIVLGDVSHVYHSGDYIVRYYDLNIMVSRTNLVMTVWRDIMTKPFYIDEEVKAEYDANTTHPQNITKANIKHKKIIKEFRVKRKEKQKKAVANLTTEINSHLVGDDQFVQVD